MLITWLLCESQSRPRSDDDRYLSMIARSYDFFSRVCLGITQPDLLHTMSTVTSPTLVAPCCLRKLLTRSCSFGILSARTFLRSVEVSDNGLRNTAEVIFWSTKDSRWSVDDLIDGLLISWSMTIELIEISSSIGQINGRPITRDQFE